MRLSVPANLLLCGEYSIIREGHIAVACALDIRAVFTIEAADVFRVIPVYPGAGTGDGFPDPLTAAVAAVFCENFQTNLPAVSVTADSSAFYREDGSKLGLGSSAAAAVGIAAALYYTVFKKTHLPEELFLTALEGHRRFQGGGSGYDVSASFHGGTGLFSSGKRPRWRSLKVTRPFRVRLVSGEKPQSSSSASAAWGSWVEENSAAAEKYDALSDRAAAGFARVLESGGDSASALHRLRRPGGWLGERIGIPANPPALKRKLEALAAAGWAGKPSGAGGELGVAFARDNGYPLGNGKDLPGQEVVPSQEGIQWFL